MWVIWTLVSFAVLGWLGYAWLAALFTKYQHTRDSVLVLVALAALALFVGSRVALQIAPAWAFGPKAAVAVGVGFTAFTLFSYLAVNLWCSLLTRKFDERIATLEEEEDSILRRLDALRWQAIRQAEYPPGTQAEGAAGGEPDETAELRKTVERWEQGGGAARIRSLKVLEWREEMGGKTVAALEEEIHALEQEISSETDEARRDQSRAKLALLKLALKERGGDSRTDEPVKVGTRPRMHEDEAALRDRLQTIHAGIQDQRAARSEFVRQRIRLTWRAPK